MPPPNDNDNELDDWALFKQSVGEVIPVHNDKHTSQKPQPKPKPRQFHADERNVMHELLEEVSDSDFLWDSGEFLSFKRPGVQDTVLRRLKRGQIAVQREMDLHGFTVAQAKRETQLFLHHAQLDTLRCVRLIHGKGHAERPSRIKSMLDQYLRHRREVLAFCSSRPERGGTGALDILLSRATL